MFTWSRIIKFTDPNYTIDAELFGTFGDFVGGVLGTLLTIFSVLLVIRTFKHQQNVTKENRKQLEKQRFNDLFFELVHLYQSMIKELSQTESYKNKNGECDMVKYTSKNFFDAEKGKVQNAYIHSTSMEKNKNKALNLYMSFYVQNPEVRSCFRTLYRIYDLIDNSNIDERSKKDYLKIIRAQLTESELFFIKSNAMSYYGKNFIKYINKYNILKHLPLFEMLEFKDFWSDLDQHERTGMNIFFHDSFRMLKRILRNSLDLRLINKKNKTTNKYSFDIEKKGTSDINITLFIDNNIDNCTDILKGLDKLDDRKIQALFDCFLKEIFLYHSFGSYNTEKDLKFYSTPITKTDNITTITSGVKNKNGNPLKLEEDFSKKKS